MTTMYNATLAEMANFVNHASSMTKHVC